MARRLLIEILHGLSIEGQLPNAVLSTTYAAQLTARNAVLPLLWQKVGGTWPATGGWDIDSSTGVVTGDADDAGPYEVTIQCTDGAGNYGTKTFAFRIAAAPLVFAGDLPDAMFGDIATYSYTISGGYGAKTVSVYSGALPTGASIDSAGNVTGTFTAGGSFAWTLRVVDADLTEAFLSDACVISVTPLVVTGAITDTTIGFPLQGAPLAITGGNGVYSLSGAPYNGTRPAGVTISIVGSQLLATGNTTTVSACSWTERVLSGDGQSVDVVCSIDVRAAWTPANLGTPPSIWLNETSSVTNVSGAASQWDDVSGHNDHVVQANSTYRPTITAAAQNGLRALTFDGVNDQLYTSTVGPSNLFKNVSAGWLMYVGKKVSTDLPGGAYRWVVHVPAGGGAGTTRAMLGMGSITPDGFPGVPIAVGRRLDADTNSITMVAGSARTDWLTSIGTMDYANRTITQYIDGEQVAQITTMSATGGATSNTTSSTQLTISGNNPSVPASAACDMVLGEVLIGGGYLPTSTEVQKLAGWAAWKWGLVANLDAGHPWKLQAPYQ
jgi:hypothetical protein